MSENRVEIDIPLVLPSRKSRLETYFWDEADEMSDQMASWLHNPSKPMAKTAVIIPVAAHQEDGAVISRAVEQYAKQKTDEPFTVFLYFNCPEDYVNSEQTASNIFDIEMIQKDYEGVIDLRAVMHAYTKPAPIGRIRKDIWDGVAKLAYFEGIYDQLDGEVIGINNDIDTQYLSPRYIKRIQDYYRDEQLKLSRDDFDSVLLQTSATVASHDYPFETHPNTAKGILWSDLADRQLFQAIGGGFEAGMVIPMTDYVKNGGFDPDAKTYETSHVARNGKGYPSAIPGTILRTSPRRYIDRFPEHGFKIWSDETFGVNDNCRDRRLMGEMPDATKEQLQEHVLASLELQTQYFLHKGIERAFNDVPLKESLSVTDNRSLDELTTRFESLLRSRLLAKLKLARQVLVRVLDMPEAAQLATENINIDEWIAINSDIFRDDIYKANAFLWDSGAHISRVDK